MRLLLSDQPVAVQGPLAVTYTPLADRWSLSGDASVNYMMTVERA